MSSLTALLALSLIQAQAGGPAQSGFGTMTLGGRVVRVEYPTAPVRQLTDDLKTWDGFAYSPVGSREWPAIFRTPGDWQPVGNKVLELPARDKATPAWRTKVVILTAADVLQKQPNGLLSQTRVSLDQAQIDSILGSLARLAGYVRADSGGATDLSLEVTIDSDVVYAGEDGFGEAFLKQYLAPRMNGGKYEAEDKVFRGPYQSAFVIHPSLSSPHVTTLLGDTSSTSVPFFATWTGGTEPLASGIEEVLARLIASHVGTRRRTLGLKDGWVEGTPHPPLMARVTSLKDVVEPSEWADLTNPEDVTFAQFSKLIQRSTVPQGGLADGGAEVYRKATVSSNVTVSIVPDPDRGSVLKYSERSPVRVGGFGLPIAKISVSQSPYFGFWVKSSSRDPLAIQFADGSERKEVVLGQDVEFKADGTWQEVVIDLKGLGLTSVGQIALVPPSQSLRVEKTEIGAIDYLFDDFKTEGLSKASGKPNPPSANAGSKSDVERAMAAKTLSADALLKDPSDLVKMNGLVDRAFAATDEPALIELSHSVNVRVAELAIKALAKLGTPTAKAEVLRLVNASPFPWVKQVAALEVGKMGDPKLAGMLSRLFAGKGVWTRLAGAQAVAMLPGSEAPVILMTFLQEIDPMVRLTVVESANLDQPVVVKRLLWTAVNDPSDAVRAACYRRLIFSGKPDQVQEGYKGVRDESVGVRLTLVKALVAQPSEEHRKALRIAVSDISPRVRAEALRGFAKLKEVSLEEIANTLEDKYPVVQMALIGLATTKNLTLPPAAIENLKASVDAKVVERAKGIGL